ncbi:DUF16 domain-containing protein [Mycoplasmoides pneumoniae]
MSNNNKYFTITKKQYKKMRRNKIELLFNVKVLKKKNGRQKFKILHEVENKPKIPIKIIEDQPESPKPPKTPKPPKPPKGPDNPEEPDSPEEPKETDQPGGPDDPNSGNKKMPKPDEFVTHRQLQEFKKDLLVELHEIFPTKPELKRVEEKVDVLFELQKAQGEQIRIQGEQIKELKVEQKAQGETLQLILQTLQKMNDRLDKIEGKMDKMESRMDKMETRLDKLESK